ncbi:MAG: MATE family efflux transporter, partial [Pseudohongiellaceae bacterium]
PARAEATVYRVMKYITWYMLLTALGLLLFAPAIVMLFTGEHEVARYAVLCLRIFSLGLIPFGFSVSVVQAFNGAGDTMTPTWINFFCFWVVQVPLAYVLAMLTGLGPVGVFWAVFVSDLLAGIVGVLVFRRGRWKQRMV